MPVIEALPVADYPSAFESVRVVFTCEHPRHEIRRYRASNDVFHYRDQCLTCGALLRTVKKDTLPLSLVVINDWDDALQARWWERREAAYEDARRRTRRRRQEEYRAYLETDEWRRKRLAVLDRDSHLCQGCLDRPATLVHHLTYEHLYRELFYELTSLCEDCHRRAHDKGAE